MKTITRIFVPLFVLAILAVSVVGVAFAREASENEGSRTSRSVQMEFTGTLEAISASSWSVAGRAVAITAATELKGLPVVGQLVKVHAFLAADGTLTAREIAMVAADGSVADDNGNSNEAGDDNGNSNEAGDDNGNSNEAGDDNGNSNEAGDDNGNSNEGGH